MRALTSVFDTGVGLDLIPDDILDLRFESHIRGREMPELYSSNNFRLNKFRTIMLHL